MAEIELIIDFWGLCGFVCDRARWEDATRVNVVLVRDSHHSPRVVFDPRDFRFWPARQAVRPSNGLEAWILGDQVVRILPGGVEPTAGALTTEVLELMPDIKRASGIGKINSRVITNDPGPWVVARVELVQGRVFCLPNEITEKVWSFLPKRTPPGCYQDRFAVWVHYALKLETTHFMIQATPFSSGATYTARLNPDTNGQAHIQITNLPPEEHETDPPHSSLYYELLDQVLPPHERPNPYEKENCNPAPPLDRGIGLGKIGCSPVLMFEID